MIKAEIRVPLLNANEPEARLVGIHVRDGQPVEKGALLFTIETTKMTSEIEAPEAGFIHILAVDGATLAVGDRLAVLTETADEKIPDMKDGTIRDAGDGGIHSESDQSVVEGRLRITKPAQQLAASLGLDPKLLPTDRLITEGVVRQLAGSRVEIVLPVSNKPMILIYGGGGHAKSVMEIVLQNGVHAIAGIVDDDQSLTGNQVLDIPILGTREILPMLAAKSVHLAANGVGGILDSKVRIRVFNLLESAGFSFPVLIHPRATVEPSAKVGQGVQVFANAYVGSEAFLGSRCMINTNAVVSHDCTIGEYTHIAPGAMLAGHVHVGARTLIGMGVTTSIGVRIGEGVRIGNGAILLADVPDNTIIQAGRFWTG
jgi:sugar O-acyltransferase (sialic acid O-acetyltransferase NeuD family)